MTERDSSLEPTWQSVKGGLIHRCVLAAPSKWLTVYQAQEPDEQHGVPEPHLVAEARWMAKQLRTAFVDEDPRMAWSLIDSGGPRWIDPYDDYKSLSLRDRVKTVEDLEELVMTAANTLLDRAREDHWEDMLSEVFDPFARLNAFTAQEKKAVNQRIDLLVHRVRLTPLIVDLKTGVHLLDVDSIAADVARKYGNDVASITNTKVRCQVLGLTFDGDCRWSQVVVARPVQNDG
jgi:hypothetical protein